MPVDIPAKVANRIAPPARVNVFQKRFLIFWMTGFES